MRAARPVLRGAVPVAVLLAGAAIPAAVPAGGPAPADMAGRQAFERGCSGCHALDVAVAQPHSAGEWAAIVVMMVARGAALSDADQDVIIAYLARHHAPGR